MVLVWLLVQMIELLNYMILDPRNLYNTMMLMVSLLLLLIFIHVKINYFRLL